jgi:nitronate monooxygenase
MWYEKAWMKPFGINYPIIQAGMAGGPTTPELVAAVSEAGGLGTIGAAYLTPETLRQTIREVKRQTNKPFGVNVFVPTEPIEDEELQVEKTKAILEPIRSRFDAQWPSSVSVEPISTNDQLEIIYKEKVPFLSFTFGTFPKETLLPFKEQGIYVMGTATTVEEAMALEETGVDAIVVQGVEAGGHRGTFDGTDPTRALIGLMALIPQVKVATGLPLIAAGGIMNGQGMLAAIVLGADGVQCGTAFLTCQEAGTHPLHKARIQTASETDIVTTIGLTGRAARGISNQFIQDLSAVEKEMAPFPLTNQMTSDIRKKAGSQGESDYMSLWAGQGLRLHREMSAEGLVHTFIAEGTRALENLNGF